MKRVLVVGNLNNERSRPLIEEGAAFLAERGVECVTVGNTVCGSLRAAETTAGVDMALVFGGDGTILNACKNLPARKIPVLGVNLGRLGYLASAEPEELTETLGRVLKGEYFLEERVTLTAGLDGEEYVGVNEAVLHRGGKPRILDIRVDINGQETDRLRADGIMAATPTGSTAYNLSAGGPVIVPTAKNLVITPICAHSLGARPIVVAEEDVITFTSLGDGEAVLSVDGNTAGPVVRGKPVTVGIGAGIRLVRTGENTFFKTLRRKLSGQY